jgi:NADH-quinone oxidoreductase subunit H
MIDNYHFWWTVITIGAIFGAIQGTCAYLILAERKISAYLQDRIGPNRVGPYGLLQPIADGLKFVLKEQIIPDHVDRLFYLLAPLIAISTAMLAFAVVPFGPTTVPPKPPRLPALPESASRAEWDVHEQARRLFEKAAYDRPVPRAELPALVVPASATPPERVRIAEQERQHRDRYREFDTYYAQVDAYNQTYQFVLAPRVSIGFLFTFAVSSLAVYAIILGGWSSNNKYSMLGGLRSSAQLISYEIPMGLSILGLVLMSHSLNLEEVVQHQADAVWYVFYQPLAFLLFLTSIFAECNRLPFDLPEAEQELVGGYHTEYSAWKFALFFLGEYTHMITTSFLAVTFFFGGWHFPGIATTEETGLGWIIVKVIVFAVKMTLFIVFYMLIRWTIPRFRFDQLMALAWKVLIPLSLANLVCVLVVEHLVQMTGADLAWRWLLLPVSLVLIALAGVAALSKPRGPRQRILVTRGHERVEVTVP